MQPNPCNIKPSNFQISRGSKRILLRHHVLAEAAAEVEVLEPPQPLFQLKFAVRSFALAGCSSTTSTVPNTPLRRPGQQLRSPGSSHGGAGSAGGAAVFTALTAASALAAATAEPSRAAPVPTPHADADPSSGAAGPSTLEATPSRASKFNKWLRHAIAPRWTELSEGDRLRRERRLAEAQAAKAAKELEGLTFKPQLSAGTAKGAYADVRPKLEVRTAPGLYMAQLAEKRRQMDDRRATAVREKQAQEMAACTFAPKILPAPQYLLAATQQAQASAYGAAELLIEERLADIMTNMSLPLAAITPIRAVAPGSLSASIVGTAPPGTPTAAVLSTLRVHATAATSVVVGAEAAPVGKRPPGVVQATAMESEAEAAQRKWQQQGCATIHGQ